MDESYPLGAVVTYHDGTSLPATGIVNGEVYADSEGFIVAVPVWSERKGREATTVVVSVENILGVERPEAGTA